MRPTVKLPSGLYFDFLELEKNVILPTDIAFSLSNLNRFTGHLGQYSVAQHSYFVSKLVPPGFEYDGLMHDSAEFVMNDLSSPLKHLLPEYKALEKRVEIMLSGKLGIRFSLPEVKQADLIMLATEKRWLGRRWARHSEEHDLDDTWDLIKGIEPLDTPLPRWTPEFAYHMFMKRFYEVKPQWVK